MDTTTDTIVVQHSQTVQRVLLEHAAIPYAHGQVVTVPVFDRDRHQYVLMDVGWEDDQRVHGCLVHVALRDGKIWIEYDGTEDGVAADLLRAGVSKDRIVLAFHRPEIRPHTGFAVA